MKLVTADQMRAIDRRSEAAGISTSTLMENAGRSVAEEAVRLLGDARGKSVLILAGPGNNGGDGLVAARHLHDAGAHVAIYLWARGPSGDGHLEALLARCVPLNNVQEDIALTALRAALASVDMVIDSLLGTGRSRPIADPLKGILDCVKAARRPSLIVLAVDLPTGLDADTGAVDPSCLVADVTITLGYPKVGLFAFPGASFIGRLVVADIGLPANIADDVQTETTTVEDVAAKLPARSPNAHKGSFGKVMVVGGSSNYVGAPVMLSVAAARVGAGLVTLACARSLHHIFAAKLTEATFVPLPDVGLGAIDDTALDPLLQGLAGYDVVAIGPGLGRAPETVRLVRTLLPRLANLHAPACVIDADALNALAGSGEWWKSLPPRVVLTPHSGEMARLLGGELAAIDSDRLGRARSAARQWGVVVVLKGAFTIVAAPDGRANINPSANPALATAGTGDVLAGAIAGLLAQGLSPFDAAVTGVFLHSKAGDLARAALGDAGVIATDLVPLLPRAIKETQVEGKQGSR